MVLELSINISSLLGKELDEPAWGKSALAKISDWGTITLQKREECSACGVFWEGGH